MKGVQYFSSTKSGRSRRKRRPTRSQLNGFTVFTLRSMRRSAGGGVSTVWLFPGKSHEGYCKLKVSIFTSWPRCRKTRAIVSMIDARPPR